MSKKKNFFKGNTILIPNTFIGGIGATITTATLLAAELDILDTDITLFSIDGNNNVQCNINTVYNIINNDAFRFDAVTYFVDLDGFLDTIQVSNFRNTNFIAFYSPSVTAPDPFGQNFRDASFNYIDMPLCTYIGISEFLNVTELTIGKFRSAITIRPAFGNTGLDHLDIRSATTFTNYISTNVFNNIALSCKIYVDPTMLTINAGGLEIELQWAVDNRSAIIIGVDNETAPGAVSNLAAVNITTTTVDLTFTAPSAANSIQHYEVWIERQDLDLWHKDRVKQIYSYHSLITTTGDTVTGLITGTTYKITIVTCDEFYNESAKSNEIEITTS